MARAPVSSSMKTLVSQSELVAAIDAALASLPEELGNRAIEIQAALATPGDWEAAKVTPAPENNTE